MRIRTPIAILYYLLHFVLFAPINVLTELEQLVYTQNSLGTYEKSSLRRL